MKCLFLIATLALTLSLASGGEIRVKSHCWFPLFIRNRGGNRGQFQLHQGQQESIWIDNGRVWAVAGCDGNGNGCETDDNSVTLAEMHWDGNGHSWYDISNVDGFNIPMTMGPLQNTGGRCETVNCNYDRNRCPNPNRLYRNGQIIACKNLQRDNPSDYSNSVKSQCPNVYTWSKDDQAGMRDCRPGNNGFQVSFC